MDKYLIDENIYKVIERTKQKTPEIWEPLFAGEAIPDTFFELFLEELILDLNFKPRHIRYIKSKIEHIVNECIEDIKEL